MGVGFLIYATKNAWTDWRENRALAKELDAAKKSYSEYRWEPNMVGGVDCGRWVRKSDGKPLDVIDLGSDVGLE